MTATADSPRTTSDAPRRGQDDAGAVPLPAHWTTCDAAWPNRQPRTARGRERPFVIVGLSGGVDSAVAAARLLAMDCRVEGLFMKNWDDDDDDGHCSAADDLAAARAVADHLGIVLHKRNFAARYRERVFDTFLAELRAGRTPNPDILCNREVKFGPFLDEALELGADHVATGHYARVLDTASGHVLAQARDANKDQTYFLHTLDQRQLARALFPLGDLGKPQVRQIAATLGLPNHARRDSTGICFIGEQDMRQFLARYLESAPGPIETDQGKTIGRHPGLCFFTLGQRQGLGIGGVKGHPEAPWYVVAKHVERNALVVSQDARHPWLMAPGLISAPVHWIAGAPPQVGKRLRARIRHRGALAEVQSWRQDADGRLTLHFAEPQRAVTPGQSVVLYADDRCLGGAVIERAEPLQRP